MAAVSVAVPLGMALAWRYAWVVALSVAGSPPQTIRRRLATRVPFVLFRVRIVLGRLLVLRGLQGQNRGYGLQGLVQIPSRRFAFER